VKIAVSGKGGVGKTLLVAALSRCFAENKKKVFAIDADPDSNLALAFGVSEKRIEPLANMRQLIRERTETSSEGWGVMFKLNPNVEDIPERYAYEVDGVKLLVLGAVRSGGGGCACPENVFLRTLINHLVLRTDEVVIMDMEAGIEHLGRATVMGIDWLIVVVEPSEASLQTAYRIKNLAEEIKLKRIGVVINKVKNEEEAKNYLKRLPEGVVYLGWIPFDEGAMKNYRFSSAVEKNIVRIMDALLGRN